MSIPRACARAIVELEILTSNHVNRFFGTENRILLMVNDYTAGMPSTSNRKTTACRLHTGQSTHQRHTMDICVVPRHPHNLSLSSDHPTPSKPLTQNTRQFRCFGGTRPPEMAALNSLRIRVGIVNAVEILVSLEKERTAWDQRHRAS